MDLFVFTDFFLAVETDSLFISNQREEKIQQDILMGHSVEKAVSYQSAVNPGERSVDVSDILGLQYMIFFHRLCLRDIFMYSRPNRPAHTMNFKQKTKISQIATLFSRTAIFIPENLPKK
jgi:hypothetical protein